MCGVWGSTELNEVVSARVSGLVVLGEVCAGLLRTVLLAIDDGGRVASGDRVWGACDI